MIYVNGEPIKEEEFDFGLISKIEKRGNKINVFLDNQKIRDKSLKILKGLNQ